MVTPAFRPGRQGPRHPVWKTAPSYGRSAPPASHGRDIDTIPKRRFSGECRPPDGMAWCIRPPALKGGVTAKFAFQASYAFQASAVLLTQDTWEVPQKTFVCQKVLQQPLFFLSYHLPHQSVTTWKFRYPTKKTRFEDLAFGSYCVTVIPILEMPRASPSKI